MKRSLLALMRLKPKCPNLVGFERCFRKRFSLSSGLYDGPRPWTAEESRKMVELYQKGLSTTQIAEQLGGRTILSVKSHISIVKNGDLELGSRKPWTAEEDSILLAKRQAGCGFKDIFIPGRSRMACQERWKSYTNPENVDPKKYGTRYTDAEVTDAEVQRIIDLRINERKSLKDIAKDMGRPGRAVTQIWRRRCKHLLPEDVLQGLRPSRAWSSEDDEILVKLYNEGKKFHEIQAYFPKKTLGATKLRLYSLRNLLVERQKNASPALMESIKRELEPYLNAPLKKADSQRIRERFPMFSATAIAGTLNRMRRGRAAPKRAPLDELEVEKGIANRSYRRVI
jgi:transposase-like protein